jgi:hypothetical protein
MDRTRSATTRAGRTKRSLLAAVALLTLGGCAGLHPGVAAVVGNDTISQHQVDDVARALCSADITGAKAQGQPAPELASRGAAQGALSILLQSELSRQLGEKHGVVPSQAKVSQALAQSEQGIAMLPQSQRAQFTETLKEYAEGQLMLIALGRKTLEAKGKTNVTDQQALAEGRRLRDQYAKSVDVEVNPRYGTFSKGSFHPGGSSLSVAASQRARAGTRTSPGASWVAGLPASQKCS